MKPNRHYFAQLSSDAYKYVSFERDGVQGIVTETDDFVTIAFRGTEKNKEDILRDLKGYPTWTPWGLLHSGFYKGALGTFPLIQKHLLTTKPIYFTGHSLGGDLALNSAALSKRHGRTPEAVYTYGAAALIYYGTLDEYLRDVEQHRFVNGADFVPTHPWLGHHCSDEEHIGPTRTPKRRFSEERWFDHRIVEGYIKNL